MQIGFYEDESFGKFFDEEPRPLEFNDGYGEQGSGKEAIRGTIEVDDALGKEYLGLVKRIEEIEEIFEDKIRGLEK
jgi:hypothetical protein